jgi:hypothetical protein
LRTALVKLRLESAGQGKQQQAGDVVHAATLFGYVDQACAG